MKDKYTLVGILVSIALIPAYLFLLFWFSNPYIGPIFWLSVLLASLVGDPFPIFTVLQVAFVVVLFFVPIWLARKWKNTSEKKERPSPWFTKGVLLVCIVLVAEAFYAGRFLKEEFRAYRKAAALQSSRYRIDRMNLTARPDNSGADVHFTLVGKEIGQHSLAVNWIFRRRPCPADSFCKATAEMPPPKILSLQSPMEEVTI